MSVSIPPDLLREFEREVSTRWSEFLHGSALSFHGVTIRKEKGRVVVGCFSEKYFFQNLSEAEARERIATAKKEIEQLTVAFPELGREISGAKMDFHFCYDDGKSACLVAKESDGQFESYIQKG